MFYCSGWQAVAIVGAGQLLAGTLRGNERFKVAFNTSQWLVAASVGMLVLDPLRSGYDGTTRNLGALILAVVVAYAVNQVLFSVILLIATGSVVGSGSPAATYTARGLGALGSIGLGVVLAAAFAWSPWALLVAFMVLPLVNYASRGYAAVRADQARLQGLQRATHALMTLHDATAFPGFLAEARLAFEADLAELVLFGSGPPSTFAANGSPVDGRVAAVGPHELAEILAPRLTEPVHLSLDKAPAEVIDALDATGHQRLLAAPLGRDGQTVGLLLFYDRLGMEGFEQGELAIAGALARELVGFLERVQLVQAIDEERRKLTDVVESTSDGILTIDTRGVITSWNNGFAAMTGYQAEEMVGTRHIGLLRARDTAGRDVIIEHWLDGGVLATDLPTELQVVSATGQTVWVSCSYSRITGTEGSNGDSLVIVARNVTQARELERLKDDFVAVVSHELRTPLVPIKGWAQTLLNRGDRLSDDQRRTAVQSILSQAQKLESLVLNILEASRVESGRLDGDSVADVTAITVRIVEETLSARPDRAVRIQPPSVPCNVRGSAVWVERAVSNLVANAVKYSPDDEPVDVAVTMEGDDVVVAVTDRGPGIATDAQDRIFERFERLEETMTQTGTGLGLYITRRLARAMGGDVAVSSVPGAGSTFTLRLPGAPVPVEPVEPRMPRQRVLDARDPNVVNLH